jgi:hypothetical protein
VRQLAAAALLLACCSHREPIASCADDLGGVWTTATGRWMVLDNRTTLEAYPLFDDAALSGAPRVIDLARGDKLEGQVKRRFVQRQQTCDARAPFHVTLCKDDTLQVVRGEVAPPLSFSPCTWGQSLPSHVENWRRD